MAAINNADDSQPTRNEPNGLTIEPELCTSIVYELRRELLTIALAGASFRHEGLRLMHPAGREM
jgi:hypothetical protein